MTELDGIIRWLCRQTCGVTNRVDLILAPNISHESHSARTIYTFILNLNLVIECRNMIVKF
jgi:hypothetical protein